MIKELIKPLIRDLETIFNITKVQQECIQDNLDRFRTCLFEDLQAAIAELKASDSRITTSETNFSTHFYFEGRHLFAASVYRLSNEVQLKVDSIKYVTYFGRTPTFVYDDKNKTIRKTMDMVLVDAFRRHLAKHFVDKLARI
jgi:hypothetical protein